MSDAPLSYWEATAGTRDHYPTLRERIEADVVVIGGGYLGLSCALHLAEAGRNVVLLEAQQPGWGASGRNGGQIIPGFKHERRHMIKTLGTERGARLFSWSGTFVDETLRLIQRHNIDCEAVQSGWIQPAHSVSALNAYNTRVEEWTQEGASPYMIDAKGAADLLGTRWYVGAYVDPRGGRLHPMKYAAGLARAAVRVGARIYANSAAESLERKADKWQVTCADGCIVADSVMICTNAYTDSGTALIRNLAQSLVPIPSYMIATAPLSSNVQKSILPLGQTAADLKQLTNHFRLEKDGRFLFGGRGQMRETGELVGYAPLKAKLSELFPQLADVQIEYHWNGRVAITMDGAPHLHNPAPGLWASVGCNGRGVGYSTVTGKLLARLICGLDPSESPIPVTQLKKIPFHRFHLLGTRFTVWRKDQQDRRARQASLQ